MKKILFTFSVAIASLAATAQSSDVQHATLSTTVPTLIALRPYDGIALADNQNLTANVTNATDVLNTNNFGYTGNGALNSLAYKIYSNVTYKVSLQANATGGSNDQLNNYITYTTSTLPSPQNGLGMYSYLNNGPDHAILSAPNSVLIDALTSKDILNNPLASTGATHPPAVGFNPAATDFAAFQIQFAVHPGFSIFPGNFTTNLTITATSL